MCLISLLSVVVLAGRPLIGGREQLERMDHGPCDLFFDGDVGEDARPRDHVGCCWVGCCSSDLGAERLGDGETDPLVGDPQPPSAVHARASVHVGDRCSGQLEQAAGGRGGQVVEAAARFVVDDVGRTLESNTVAMQWPPRSGHMREVPEVDRAAWLTPEDASRKILKGQRPVIEALLRHLGLADKPPA